MSRRVWFRTASAAACVALVATVAPASALTAAPTVAAAAAADNPDGTHTVTLDLVGDTWVSSSGATSSQTTSPELRVGSNNLGLVKSRSYLDFDYTALAAIPADAVVSSELTLSNFVTGSCRGTAVRASRITGAWTFDALKWSAQPAATTLGSGTSTASYGAGACPTEGDVTFDVSGIVKSWLGGTAERGILVKADREGAAAGYRKYRSAENGDAAKAPTLTVTYNSYPGTPTDVAFAPGVGSYVTSLTPTLSATVSDPDGGLVSGSFEVHKGTGSLSPIVWTGTSDAVASGEVASVTVPAGILLDGTVYSVAVRGSDGVLTSKAFAATAFRTDVTAPTVMISAAAYSDGEWLTGDPVSSTFTFDGAVDTAGFHLDVDGTEYTVGSNASGGDYKVTWTPTPGWHVIKATPVDKAGNVGTQQTFSFGAGSATFVAPTMWQTSTADFPVVMTAPPGATGATLLWRFSGEETWRSAAHVSSGAEEWDGTVDSAGGYSSTGALTWHASEEPVGNGTLTAPALIQVRGCFQYDDAEDSCTPDLYVGLISPDEE